MAFRSTANAFLKVRGITSYTPLQRKILSFPALQLTRSRFATSAGSEYGDANQLLLSLSSPSEKVYSNTAISSITLPGVEGEFTVFPQHSPFITFIKNGVITVRPVNTTQESQYFVSNGVCIIQGPTEDNASSKAEVLAVELVPVDFLDKEKTAQVLQEILQSTAGSNDDWDKAKSILSQELCSAILRAAP